MNVASWSRPPFLCLLRSIEGVDINDGVGKGFRSLLRQIVPYAAGEVAMLVPTDVLLGIDARVSMRCAVRVAFQRDCRTSDRWKCRDLFLQFIVFSLAGLQAQIPAVVVQRDTNEIRIFKRRSRAIERFIVERPLR